MSLLAVYLLTLHRDVALFLIVQSYISFIYYTRSYKYVIKLLKTHFR